MHVPRRRSALMPRPSAAVMAHISAVELGARLTADTNALLAPYELTLPQYNLLRVLYVRDPSGEGIASGELGTSLLARVPDITRFVDRLARRGLVERFRSEQDRRSVLCRLTDKGADAVEAFHPAMLVRNAELFAHMSAKQVESLSQLLLLALESSAGELPP